jgi:hypothetical protein
MANDNNFKFRRSDQTTTPVAEFPQLSATSSWGPATALADLKVRHELAPLASDMWGTQKRLEEKDFRVDRGNKSATGWRLTVNNRNRMASN